MCTTPIKKQYAVKKLWQSIDLHVLNLIECFQIEYVSKWSYPMIKKNKIIIACLSLALISGYPDILMSGYFTANYPYKKLSSHLQNFSKFINANLYEINNYLYQAEQDQLAHNFEIALYAGNAPYLEAIFNKSFALRGSENDANFTRLVNYIFDKETESRPLHIAVEIAAYHKNRILFYKPGNNKDKQRHHQIKYQEMIRTIRFLLEHGADVNATNNSWQTPLHIACVAHDFEITSMLLNNFIDQKAEDMQGKAAFDYVVEYFNELEQSIAKNQSHEKNKDTRDINAEKREIKLDYYQWERAFKNQPVKKPSCYQAIMAGITNMFKGSPKIAPAPLSTQTPENSILKTPERTIDVSQLIEYKKTPSSRASSRTSSSTSSSSSKSSASSKRRETVNFAENSLKPSQSSISDRYTILAPSRQRSKSTRITPEG